MATLLLPVRMGVFKGHDGLLGDIILKHLLLFFLWSVISLDFYYCSAISFRYSIIKLENARCLFDH
jgi:hypothetical protein